MKLVEFFSDYWKVVLEGKDKDRQLERLAERVEILTKDNTKLAQALEAAQQAIQSNPSYLNNVMDLLQKYQEKILTEEPYPDGRVPEKDWLTPAYLEDEKDT